MHATPKSQPAATHGHEEHSHHPVTIVTARRVKPGREAEYHEWVRGISQEAMRFEGSLGIRILRPPDASHAEHEAVFFFSDHHYLQVWENSPERHAWQKKAEPFTEGSPDYRIVTGLEYFFVPPSVGVAVEPRPPAWKQASVVLLAVYPCTMAVYIITHSMLLDWPHWLASLVRCVLVVHMMTYAVLPFLTRLLSPWLYGKAKA
ncbi:MAG: hypothetical protein ACAI35_11125 [Candidatus Methylacidiphilales bacterium]|nr:hypothetical protein [Candidatus Methylacidiphilales bacterium]